ncbi:PAS domain-containing sensor histidine kinase [Corallococcus sp. H22C18031201]|uniref:PAS domain-containing protein n=1 Tax=Citreicoccus inhibens TaxID=2849499 RepID=UPI000E746334|nr:PAS domain-containing protein [Citreicoccus inhibens]MBU8899390.1 PAS domain-containing protein [Citreicoccus inhibens]RJS23936.1 PAS domain-containing sensor histidine kinase [Corallococcus sp. H22C18031201]
MAHAAGELEVVMDAAVDPLVVCGTDERILHVNAATERLLGWSRARLLGQPVSRLFPVRLRTFAGHSLPRYLLSRRAALGGRPIRVFALREDGVEVLVELTVGTAGEGEHARIALTFRGLHEVIDTLEDPVEQAEPGMSRHLDDRARDRLYRLLVENAPLGIFHFDRTPVVTACNERFVDMLGSTKRVIVGLNLLTLRDDRLMDAVRETLKGHASDFEGDYVAMTSGKVTPVRVRFAPCYAEDGLTVEGGVGLVEDISEHRHTEAERERHLAQLDMLFHSAPIGLGFVDTNLRYARVNDVLARINGVPAEAHLGRRPHEVLGPAGVPIERMIRQVMETGEPAVKHEVRTDVDLGAPGPRRYLAGSFYPVRAPDGRMLGVGILVEDISERRRAEEERNRLYREAQEAIRVRDDFLSIASHELKTPLTPLSLRLETLERKLERGEPVDASVLHRARRQLLRLTGLINDLLDASRIEAGRLALHPEPTRFDTLVENGVRAMEAQREDHLITFEHPREPVRVHGDSYRLEQVVTNLLENALKYSPDGGTIRVALTVRGDVALLSVTDPGIGIPPDQQALLFDRYFRARNVSARSYGGLGLGLYISRDIVERHGGRIWVESEVGHGSTFYVALPLQPAAHVSPDTSHAGPPAH